MKTEIPIRCLPVDKITKELSAKCPQHVLHSYYLKLMAATLDSDLQPALENQVENLISRQVLDANVQHTLREQAVIIFDFSKSEDRIYCIKTVMPYLHRILDALE